MHPSLWAALALLSLAACKKDKDDDNDTPAALDYVAATDNAKAEDYFNDMLQQVDAAAADNGLRDLDEACDPTVTIDTVAMPHTMLIDFGNTDCTAANGRTRRGQLAVTFTGRYRDQGTVITITPQNYYVSGNHVEGTKTVTNMGFDGDHHPYFNVTVDGTVTAGDGSWHASHHAQRVRTWTGGYDTPTPLDDTYAITGSGNGTNRNGVNYTVQITNALHVAVGCPFILQGTVQITPQDHAVRTIDYGNGACDGTFTVTVNDHSYTVTIG
ncbi:MAG TPA: hypothetical protein VHL57_04220 [Flavobacteriales bacterium]|nr:hypothetical protein [Flavobacteriales bacterium]